MSINVLGIMSTFHKTVIGFLLFFITLASYLFVSGGFVWNLSSTPFAYFNLLAESFLARRYDLIHPPANPFDLSTYQGAVYLPWGPLPAVLLMPAIYLFGTELSDKVYTAFFGAVNVGMFYFVLLEFKKLYSKLTFSHVVFLALLFAFGTVHFSAATIARVWFTSQIMSLTTYLISLFLLFVFVRKKNIAVLVFSIGFLALATLGRLWYVMMTPMYIYIIFTTPITRRQKWYLFVGVLTIGLIFVRMYGLYNFRRFGSYVETGYSYQQESEKFLSLRHTFGRYHPRYITSNIWHELLKPTAVQKDFPFIKPNPEGNGIFATSPLFLLLFFLKKAKKHKKLIILFFLGIIPYVFQLMFFFGAGYFQFGARYLLDIIPLMTLATAIVIPYTSKKLVYTLVTISIVINSLGATWLVFNY